MAWLYGRLSLEPLVGDLRIWIVAVMIVDGISVIIDTADVVRYAAGDRNPSFRLEEPAPR